MREKKPRVVRRRRESSKPFLAREQMSENEQRLRVALSGVDIAVFNQDRELRYTWMFRPQLGYAVEEVLGKTDAELLPPEAAQYLMRLKRQVLERATPVRKEVSIRWKGRTHIYDLAVEPMRNGRDEVVGIAGASLDITKRKRAERALRASEKQLGSLFENMLEGFAYCRMLYQDGVPHDFEYLIVNHAFETLTGLKNVVGRKVSDVIPGIRETNPELFETYGRVATTGHPEKFETYVEALGIWFSISVYGPEPGHFVAVFDNITDRKRAEDSQRLFRTLLDRSTDMIQVVDPGTGRLLDVNERACLELGYSREELLSLRVHDLDPTIDDTSFPRAIEKLRESGVMRWQGLHRRKDGSTFPVEVNVSLVRSGREYAVAVVRDVSERLKAELDRARLGAVVEQSAESVVMTDSAGAIQYVNPAFERLTGYARQEVLGLNPRILKSGKQDAAFYRAMWGALTRGDIFNGRLINRRKDGTEYQVQATIFPLRDPGGRQVGYVAIERDVTVEVSLERQLRQAQKMEAVGRLAGGVAHDFNNLLTVILSNAALAKEGLSERDPARADIEEIEDASVHAAALTRQLLAFARQQVAEPRALDLNAVVLGMDKMLRRLIGEDVDLVALPGENLGTVRADPGHMEQVLVNMAVNARDAMPIGGKLTIETSNATLDAEYAAHHGSVPPGEYVMLAVSDTGQGMTPEVQEHIFEPFYTTKEMGKGTGLGLATCYGIIKQGGGWIWVYSEPGRGTTFKIYLPRIQAPAEPLVPNPSTSPASLPRGSETILVAEDDAKIRTVVSRALRNCGYRVLEAANGADALRIAENEGEPIALLVTDIVMPLLGGRELADRLGALKPQIRVLYTSGYTQEAGVLQEALKRGGAFLPKPFDSTRLLRKVREVLDAPSRV